MFAEHIEILGSEGADGFEGCGVGLGRAASGEDAD